MYPIQRFFRPIRRGILMGLARADGRSARMLPLETRSEGDRQGCARAETEHERIEPNE